MTISLYYKCDFCGEKIFIYNIDEIKLIKRCPYCRNEYEPFNLIEEISPDSVLTFSKNSSKSNLKNYNSNDINSLFDHSPKYFDSNSEQTKNNEATNIIRDEKKPSLWQKFLGSLITVIIMFCGFCGKEIGEKFVKETVEQNKNNHINEFVVGVNKFLPKRIDSITTFEKVGFIDNKIIYFYSVDTDFNETDLLLIKFNLKSKTTEDTRKMFKRFNKKIVLRYKSKLNGKTRDISINPNEL